MYLTNIFLSSKSKDGDINRGWPEGPLFNNYHTEV